MRGLKKHTGLADEGERRFKGWSDKGHKAFEACTMSIKDDVVSGKHALWERACREVHAMQKEARMGEEQPPVMKHAASRSAVWELQRQTAGELSYLKIEFKIHVLAACNCRSQQQIQNWDLGHSCLKLSCRRD
jgi:hypothetical protein